MESTRFKFDNARKAYDAARSGRFAILRVALVGQWNEDFFFPALRSAESIETREKSIDNAKRD